MEVGAAGRAIRPILQKTSGTKVTKYLTGSVLGGPAQAGSLSGLGLLDQFHQRQIVIRIGVAAAGGARETGERFDERGANIAVVASTRADGCCGSGWYIRHRRGCRGRGWTTRCGRPGRRVRWRCAGGRQRNGWRWRAEVPVSNAVTCGALWCRRWRRGNGGSSRR